MHYLPKVSSDGKVQLSLKDLASRSIPDDFLYSVIVSMKNRIGMEYLLTHILHHEKYGQHILVEKKAERNDTNNSIFIKDIGEIEEIANGLWSKELEQPDLVNKIVSAKIFFRTFTGQSRIHELLEGYEKRFSNVKLLETYASAAYRPQSINPHGHRVTGYSHLEHVNP